MPSPDLRHRTHPWRSLYRTPRWQEIRREQLSRFPLCEPCRRQGRVTAATTVHHKVPHRGNASLFFAGPFESHCKVCHDSIGQEEDRKGFTSTTNAHGFPIDPRHPFNASSEHKPPHRGRVKSLERATERPEPHSRA